MLIACLLSLLLCVGCGEDDQSQPADRETKPNKQGNTGGSTSYMGELQKGLKKGREKPKLLALRNELKQFHALKGHWPATLKKFAEWRNAPLPDLPEGRSFQYNSETGKIKIVETQ